MTGGVTMRLTRTMSQTSRRFLRDVAASVLATGVASVAFSHLAHERVPPETARAARKFDERLSWRTEDVPTRQTTTYDTLAMFSLPLSVETAWSDVPARPDQTVAALPVDLAKLDVGRPELVRASHPRVAVATTERPARVVAAALPPSRPGGVAAVAAVAPGVPVAAEIEPRPIRVLGWAVPGSDLIPSGPDALQKVASLGGRMASIGGTIAETVGLR